MSRSLFNITEELMALDLKLEESGGDLTEELEAELDAISGEFYEKIQNIGDYVRYLNDQVNAAKTEQKRLQELVRIRKAKADRMKDYAKKMMLASGRDRVDTPNFRLSVQNNSRPSIRWTRTPEEIPEAFRKVETTVDGQAAYDYFKKHEGKLPDGFVAERGTHLRIT